WSYVFQLRVETRAVAVSSDRPPAEDLPGREPAVRTTLDGEPARRTALAGYVTAGRVGQGPAPSTASTGTWEALKAPGDPRDVVRCLSAQRDEPGGGRQLGTGDGRRLASTGACALGGLDGTAEPRNAGVDLRDIVGRLALQRGEPGGGRQVGQG